jgi:intracellular septation protein
MKLLIDFLPVILFFVTFKLASSRAAEAAAWATQHLGFMVAGGVVGAGEAPILLATVVVVIATLVQVAAMLALGKKVEPALWVSLALIVVLGGLTIYLRSETFIKWKPTLLYAVMALVLTVAHLGWRKNLMRSLLGSQLALPDGVWLRLLWLWVAFFAAMAIVNIWVAYSFPTEVWVNFKLFGLMGLMIVFVLAQGVYLSKHLPDQVGKSDRSAP